MAAPAPQRLLILGASGGVGRELVTQAAARGHEVRALVREESECPRPEGVEVLHGDPLDAAILRNALRDREAVLSAVGIRRRVPWNPFSRLVSPPDLVERLALQLVSAMLDCGLRRLVLCSAAGAGATRSALTLATRLLTSGTQVRHAYRDLGRAESALRTAGVDLRVAYPVTLVDGPPRGTPRPTARYQAWHTIRRSEVAAWMLEQAETGSPAPVPQALRA